MSTARGPSAWLSWHDKGVTETKNSIFKEKTTKTFSILCSFLFLSFWTNAKCTLKDSKVKPRK